MAILKCKMCGGELSFEEGSSVCECEYCGSKQTIPNIDDEKKAKLYERANRLRMNGEFDKAYGVYESIVSDFEEDAEAYWGLVLCKYGIEYVEDPASGNRIPTCHRSSFDSVMKDENFEMVMEYSDSIARSVYREQAKAIEEIRKGIVEVSSKEEPYDIFICYKETSNSGERTMDSVLAQDVYDALTDKGYRVFFSRITLEDKLGQEYEPYIFAALNSAKIMLAFGTSYDYYNAVWVKNEWSRFLKIMSKEKGKYLIPCYKDIDAYDIPEEFAKFQAQDMGKVGAVQDLVRGIQKLLPKNETENTAPVTQIIGGPNVDALLKRGFLCLEDKAFEEAKKCFDDVLNSNVECAEAYLGLFMSEIKAESKDAAKKSFVKENNYTQNRFWLRAIQFATGELSDELQNWEKDRVDRLQSDAVERKNLKSLLTKIESGEIDLTQEQLQNQNLFRIKVEELRTELSEEEQKNADYESKIQELEQQITEYMSQLSALGLFKGQEKKRITAIIEDLTKSKTKVHMSKKVCENNISQMKLAINNTEKAMKEQFDAIKSARKNNILEQLGIKDGYMTFGNYEQEEGIIKPIEWKILRRDGLQMLLISKYGLEDRAYHNEHVSISWQKCSLRKWLNTEFLNTAFSPEEIREIMTGNDRVFLLSSYQLEKFFPNKYKRYCELTERVKAERKKSGKFLSDEGTGYWWLQSTGEYENTATVVGSILGDLSSYSVDDPNLVRPALWINLGEIGELQNSNDNPKRQNVRRRALR